MIMFQDQLPTKSFDVVKASAFPKSLTIEIEARRVRFSDNASWASQTPNAWRYVRAGSAEAGCAVLDVALGPIINVWRGETLKVKWVNELGSMPATRPGDGPTLEMAPINPLPMDFPDPQWKAMNPSVGVVTHLHGAKVKADSDGWPLAPASFAGNPYGFSDHLHYVYDNDQRAAMLWFHDHAMDNTSVQVHAGLAGLYFVRDASDDAIFGLIGGKSQEIPLVIQDRVFDCGFDAVDYWAGVPTDGAAFVRPEYLGETIFVNGRPWPYLTVQRKVYRLRVLNGSNGRTYALALVDPSGWASMAAARPPRVWFSDLLAVIGNDGGLSSVSRRPEPTGHILIAPGERLDLLLDLGGADSTVASRLRLVNLAVSSAAAGDWPQAIFQSSEDMSFPGAMQPVPSSLVSLKGAGDAFDPTLLPLLSNLGPANVMEFCVDGAATPAPALDRAALDTILASFASEDGFLWDGSSLGADPAKGPVVANRFVLLMNNTDPNAASPSPFTGEDYRDTQIWELSRTPGPNAAFDIPFDAPMSANPTVNPPAGAPSAATPYYVTRSAFFATYPAAKRIDQAPYGYDQLNANVIKPKAGTYERWYVANIGNQQPLAAGVSDPGKGGATNVPDMHPFHMHLVNFVVQRRWRLDPNAGVFDETTGARPLDLDKIARHDTVRIQSNELLELLVYFPPGYTGRYPYHCHLVEHEDMGMMSHFEVQA
jgi:FtsP/CotA-like multicopper oxidase with cupredoxin domain